MILRLKLPKSRVLSRREVQRFLEDAQYAVDHDLSRVTSTQGLDFADGRALVLLPDGKARLYDSKSELQTMLAEVEEQARKGPINPLRTLLPQGRAFAEQVPQLIHEFSVRMHLDQVELDGFAVETHDSGEYR